MPNARLSNEKAIKCHILVVWDYSLLNTAVRLTSIVRICGLTGLLSLKVTVSNDPSSAMPALGTYVPSTSEMLIAESRNRLTTMSTAPYSEIASSKSATSSSQLVTLHFMKTACLKNDRDCNVCLCPGCFLRTLHLLEFGWQHFWHQRHLNHQSPLLR